MIFIGKLIKLILTLYYVLKSKQFCFNIVILFMNRMKQTVQFLFLCVFINFSFSAYAQRGGNGGSRGERPQLVLKGQVVDKESGAGLEFATISVFSKKDSTVMGGGLSMTDGVFEVQTKPGRLFAEIEFIGYNKTVIDPLPIDRDAIRNGDRIVELGKIEMSVSASQLDEVTIRAEKSQNTFSLDKRVFNVGKDLANRGGTAEDILDNVPSVTVDIDGTVNLRGSTGVRILINGQPSSFANEADGLKAFPADMIERVEVITNPSARYEAEGIAGIINIVLVKQRESGFNGAFNSSVSFPLGASLGANVNYRKNKINWFANYTINYRSSPGFGQLYQEVYLEDETLQTEQYRDMQRFGLSNTLRGGMEYFFTDKSSISGSIQYRVSDDGRLTGLTYLDYVQPADEPFSTTNRLDTESEDEAGLQYNVDYKHEFSSRDHTLNVRLQYEDEGEVESSDLVQNQVINGTEIPTLFQRSNNNEGQQNYTISADYVQPIGGKKDHKYELGYRTSVRNIRNAFKVEDLIDDEWVPLVGFTNDFNYDEDIHALYGQYGNKFGKFSFQVGLRAEYAIINTELLNTGEQNKRDTLNFFPSTFLNYNFNEANALQISYSRRVRRPRFRDLNPFFSFSDPRNFYSGNPNLNPEYTDSYELNYLRYWENATLSGGVFYRRTTDLIFRIRERISAEQFLIAPQNLGIGNDFGFEMNGNIKVKKWMRLNGNANFFRSISDSGTDDPSLDADTYVFTSRLTSQLNFWNSDVQIRANYRGPRITPQGRSLSITSVDLGWSKDLLPKKNLTVTLSVRDLFNSRKRRYETFGDDFYSTGEFQWRQRTWTLAASYRVNRKKERSRGERGGGEFEGGEF